MDTRSQKILRDELIQAFFVEFISSFPSNSEAAKWAKENKQQLRPLALSFIRRYWAPCAVSHLKVKELIKCLTMQLEAMQS